MNKTIIININSIVFHIEEEAYEILRSYMIDIKRHFGKSSDSQEILQDIENRIAEMFSEKIHIGRKEVISIEDVNQVINQMGKVSDFDGGEEGDTKDNESTYTAFESVDKKLLRNPEDKVIGGVCSGLAAYFGMETKWMRVIFICFFLFGGSGVMLYVILWIVMPLAVSRADKMAMKGESPNLQNFKKSYEKELQDVGPHISRVKNEFSKGTSLVGRGFSRLIRAFGRLIALFLMVISALTIFGLAITCIGFITGVLGYQHEMVFPGTEILSSPQAIIALIAGTLSIVIPFIALLQILIRLLFKTQPMNHYFSLGLWATWISSIIAVVFFSFVGAQEFKESSTIKVEKPLSTQKIYYFSKKDIRLIEASVTDKEVKKLKVELNGEDLQYALRDNISINFESIDSLSKPYIQYNYFAKGRTYQSATTNAADINYVATEVGSKTIFNSHFALNPNSKYRDQSVSVTIYLPQGARVVIDNSLRDRLWNLPYWDCKKSYQSEEEVTATEWIMGRFGLQCTPKFLPVIKTSNETEHLEKQNATAEKIVKETEERIRKVEKEAKEIIERTSKSTDELSYE